jgi:hypothetical protein
MKKHILVVTLIAGASLAVAAAENPSPSPSVALSPSPSEAPPAASPTPTHCPENSASVEVHSFYGSKKTVVEKVADLQVNLSGRRVFLQITQSGRTKSANTAVKLFEQQKDGSFTVREWTETKAPGLFDEIDDAIIKNKGKNCVGKAIEDVLTQKLGTGKTARPLTAPVSPKDAFTPSVEDASGDFIKSVVIFGC